MDFNEDEDGEMLFLVVSQTCTILNDLEICIDKKKEKFKMTDLQKR